MREPSRGEEMEVDEASELMERVRARDADAFERLYDQHHRLAYGIALRMLADPILAEDVVQNVFLKLWSSPSSFRAGNFAAWLARTTRNRSIDLLRGKKLRSEDVIPETMPTDVVLEDNALASMDAELVRGAMERLPAEQRELIEWGFFGGATHHEMARRLALPLGTVKTRIRSGLHKLREALKEAVTV